jgi:hypothetical protein
VVHERPVQLDDGASALGYEVQGPAEPRHREERQLSSYMYVMDSFLLIMRDTGAGEAVQGDGDGHGDPEGHTLQDAECHHADGGDGVHRHLSVAAHRADVVQ